MFSLGAMRQLLRRTVAVAPLALVVEHGVHHGGEHPQQDAHGARERVPPAQGAAAASSEADGGVGDGQRQRDQEPLRPPRPHRLPGPVQRLQAAAAVLDDRDHHPDRPHHAQVDVQEPRRSGDGCGGDGGEPGRRPAGGSHVQGRDGDEGDRQRGVAHGEERGVEIGHQGPLPRRGQLRGQVPHRQVPAGARRRGGVDDGHRGREVAEVGGGGEGDVGVREEVRVALEAEEQVVEPRRDGLLPAEGVQPGDDSQEKRVRGDMAADQLEGARDQGEQEARQHVVPAPACKAQGLA
jgi:hypothetical protein